MDYVRKSSIAREWAVFALSIGVGGHVILGLVLHRPDAWPISQAGLFGLFVGLAVYVGVQVVRSLWWLLKERRDMDSLEED